MLTSFTEAMRRLDGDIDDRPATERHFSEAGAAYEALGGILIEQTGRNVDIAVPIENRPRVLAQVTTLMGSNDINIVDLYMQHSDTRHAALVLTIDAGLGRASARASPRGGVPRRGRQPGLSCAASAPVPGPD